MKAEKIFRVMALASILVIGAYVAFFWGALGLPLSNDPAIWGAFGDYVGGILNPFVALFGLYFVIATLKQNQVALSQAEMALKQTEKALEQSEKALLQNAEELSNSRAELTASRMAQQNLAETEEMNLKLQMSQFRITAIQARLEYLEDVLDLYGTFKLNKPFLLECGANQIIRDIKEFRDIPSIIKKNNYRVVLNEIDMQRLTVWLADRQSALEQHAGLLRELKQSVEDIDFMYIPPNLPKALILIKFICSLNFEAPYISELSITSEEFIPNDSFRRCFRDFTAMQRALIDIEKLVM